MVAFVALGQTTGTAEAGSPGAAETYDNAKLRIRFENLDASKAYSSVGGQMASNGDPGHNWWLRNIGGTVRPYARVLPGTVGNVGTTPIPSASQIVTATWLEFEHDVAPTGTGNAVRTVRYSNDTTYDHAAVVWTDVASSTTAISGETMPVDPTGNLWLGSVAYATGADRLVADLYRAVFLYDDVVIADCLPDRDAASSGDTSWTDPQGNTWSLTGTTVTGTPTGTDPDAPAEPDHTGTAAGTSGPSTGTATALRFTSAAGTSGPSSGTIAAGVIRTGTAAGTSGPSSGNAIPLRSGNVAGTSGPSSGNAIPLRSGTVAGASAPSSGTVDAYQRILIGQPDTTGPSYRAGPSDTYRALIADGSGGTYTMAIELIDGRTGAPIWSTDVADGSPVRWWPAEPSGPLTFRRGRANRLDQTLRVPLDELDDRALMLPQDTGHPVHPQTRNFVRLWAGHTIDGQDNLLALATLVVDGARAIDDGTTTLILDTVDVASLIDIGAPQPYRFPEGTNNVAAAVAVLTDIVPAGTELFAAPTRYTLPASDLQEGGNVAQFIDAILIAAGMELTVDAYGRFIIGAVAATHCSTTMPPDWAYGDDGIPVDTVGATLATPSAPSGIVLKSTGAGGSSDDGETSVVIVDADPTSLTFYDPAGPAPFATIAEMSSPYVRHEAQAKTAAWAMLRRNGSGGQRVTFTAAPNPALRTDQVIEFAHDRLGVVPGLWTVQAVTLPIEPDAPMSVEIARSWDAARDDSELGSTSAPGEGVESISDAFNLGAGDNGPIGSQGAAATHVAYIGQADRYDNHPLRYGTPLPVITGFAWTNDPAAEGAANHLESAAGLTEAQRTIWRLRPAPSAAGLSQTPITLRYTQNGGEGNIGVGMRRQTEGTWLSVLSVTPPQTVAFDNYGTHLRYSLFSPDSDGDWVIEFDGAGTNPDDVEVYIWAFQGVEDITDVEISHRSGSAWAPSAGNGIITLAGNAAVGDGEHTIARYSQPMTSTDHWAEVDVVSIPSDSRGDGPMVRIMQTGRDITGYQAAATYAAGTKSVLELRRWDSRRTYRVLERWDTGATLEGTTVRLSVEADRLVMSVDGVDSEDAPTDTRWSAGRYTGFALSAGTVDNWAAAVIAPPE